jgi:hypothetical protein
MTEHEFRTAVDALCGQLLDAVKSGQEPVRYDVILGALLRMVDILVSTAPEAERAQLVQYTQKSLKELVQHISMHAAVGPSATLN